MISWLYRAQNRRSQRELTGKEEPDRFFAIESLENRTMLAAALGAPTLLDPIATSRVDQSSYVIRGVLQQVAKNNTTVSAYRDTNQNGVYNAGVDALAASAVVPKKTTAFAVSVPLIQDSNNQFFLIANEGG